MPDNYVQKHMDHYPYEIILASASPRRQELLKSLGFPFRVQPLSADESTWPAEKKAQEIPMYLAELKAKAYPSALQKNELLITSDTVVWCQGRVYNKPENFGQAVAMLQSLSGRMHQVFTAVCLTSATQKKLFYDETKVYFKELKLEEITYYVERCKPYDKAGAYGVQEWIGYVAIEKIEGSFYNVMGLPVKKLYEQLMSF
jgi:septum formation protein